MPLTSGSRLGPYEIVAPLGAGGMGEVYRAHDTRLGREVAVKVLPEPFARDPDRLARFEREARAVAALTHPNILAIHDYGSQGDITYAVMELLDGETLGRRLARGPLGWRETGAETMTAILHDEPSDATRSSHPVPAELARIIRQCLPKNPNQRLQSARDLALGLRATASDPGLHHVAAGRRSSRLTAGIVA